jgi:hypothetical protein
VPAKLLKPKKRMLAERVGFGPSPDQDLRNY